MCTWPAVYILTIIRLIDYIFFTCLTFLCRCVGTITQSWNAPTVEGSSSKRSMLLLLLGVICRDGRNDHCHMQWNNHIKYRKELNTKTYGWTGNTTWDPFITSQVLYRWAIQADINGSSSPNYYNKKTAQYLCKLFVKIC